jgi:hypothetical protein
MLSSLSPGLAHPGCAPDCLVSNCVDGRVAYSIPARVATRKFNNNNNNATSATHTFSLFSIFIIFLTEGGDNYVS